MTIATTDVRGTAEHQIEVAAKALGGSSQRRAVFREIHSGKKRTKTIAEIADAVALPAKAGLGGGRQTRPQADYHQDSTRR